MSECIKIKNGLNIQLNGEAYKILSDLPLPDVFAIKPSDFPGISPKMLVKAGDEVLAGSPLFFDKNNESIIFSSPVSGEIIEVIRGEKRRILEIKILADKKIKYLDLTKADPGQLKQG
jgi:Na+-transporting NADH:ubiquinone oxidoreductase subunit A